MEAGIKTRFSGPGRCKKSPVSPSRLRPPGWNSGPGPSGIGIAAGGFPAQDDQRKIPAARENIRIVRGKQLFFIALFYNSFS
jgi:hypothetical protein